MKGISKWCEVLKSDSDIQKKLVLFALMESPIKVVKKYIFTIKAVVLRKIFKFLSWLFVHAGKRLDKKAKVFPKFIISTGKQIITRHILLIISESDGKLIEY